MGFRTSIRFNTIPIPKKQRLKQDAKNKMIKTPFTPTNNPNNETSLISPLLFIFSDDILEAYNISMVEIVFVTPLLVPS